MTRAERDMLERGVIGRLLQRDQFRIPTLRSEFFNGAHRKVYDAMLAGFRENGSTDVIDVARRTGLTVYDVSSYTSEDSAASPHAEFALREAWIDEQLGLSWTKAGREPNGLEKLYALKGSIAEIDSAIGTNERRTDPFEDMRKSLTEKNTLYKTGLGAYDEATGGIEHGEYVILAAHPSRGKSALACTLAWNMAAYGVAYHSYEMLAAQVIRRIVSRLSLAQAPGVSIGQIKTGHVPHDRVNSLVDLTRAVEARLPAIYDTAGKDCMILCDDIRRSPELIHFVDHIGKIPFGRVTESRERITGISNALVSTAKSTKKIIIGIAPLNRESSKTGAPPKLHDLKDSSALEFDGDTIVFLHDPLHEENKRDRIQVCDIELCFEKMRDGETGPRRAKFDKAHSFFYDFPDQFTEQLPAF